MKLVHKFECVKNVYLSENGTKAWKSGERPLFLWPENERDGLVETVPHHVSVPLPGRYAHPQARCWDRLLLMFYKKA